MSTYWILFFADGGPMDNGMKLFLRVMFLLVKYYFKHHGSIKPILKSFFYYNKRIRISAAALLELEVDGKFVLIKNHHRQEYYAPIGGVYKFISDTPRLLKDLQWTSDYTTHQNKVMDMRNDVRGVIPGKYLPIFIEWFISRKDREGDQCLLREIKEEMQEGKFEQLWLDKSSDIKFKLEKTILEGPNKVEESDYHAQFRYFEIYSLDYSDSQTVGFVDELHTRARNNQNNLVSATKEEIYNRRVNNDQLLIADHTKYYFTQDWHGKQPVRY